MDIFDKDIEYIQSILKNRDLMQTEKFQNWISITKNQDLFNEYMAYREAVMRHKSKRTTKIIRMKYIATIYSIAAIIAIIFMFLPQKKLNSQLAQSPIRVFSAINNNVNVTLRSDNIIEEITDDSVMNVCNENKHNSEQRTCYQTLSTPRGKDFIIILSDGTKVWINAESSLTYPTNFDGTERKVELTGEACFEVTKDKEHPFIVSANGIETKVLGTKFNIRSYTNNQNHVTLINGKVMVKNTENNRSSILEPGQDISYREDGQEIITNVNTAKYIAWTEGMFYFEDSPIGDIINSIGRWYNVNIDIQGTDIYNIHLNFWANRNDNIENVLLLLNKLDKVKAEYKNETISIRKN